MEARRRLSCGPSGRLRVNAADTLGAITRIFVARCESSVKSLPLGCKNRRWAWRSEPLQTAVCSSHRSVSRSQRNASVCVCVFGPRADSVTNTNSPNALHCPSFVHLWRLIMGLENEHPFLTAVRVQAEWRIFHYRHCQTTKDKRQRDGAVSAEGRDNG